jgi:methylated-DNA-[protein]-cysteine S-methyltransferase
MGLQSILLAREACWRAPGGPMTCCWQIESIAGPLLLVGEPGRLQAIHFLAAPGAEGPRLGWQRDATPFAAAIRQLDEYSAGQRRNFELALDVHGTPFQLRVWQVLRAIPYGRTVSYGVLAAHIGQPGASRAVGAANHANPLPIVIPCHRVIGADGSMTGFGGGIEIKRRLLQFEVDQVEPREFRLEPTVS